MYFIYDKFYLKHGNGPFHPESPERLKNIKIAVDSMKPGYTINHIRPLKADEKQIGMVHYPEYIEKVKRLSSEGRLSFLDADTGVNKHTYSCALLAAGGCFTGLDHILKPGTLCRRFFLACRPPGHHAFPYRGSGFCIFNNIALGIKYARGEYGIKKVAVVDFDAHHGNATQEIFYEDSNVFYISMHQYPYYPGTGDLSEVGYGRGEGFNLNLPFASGTKEPDYLVSIVDIILPLLERFEPGLVMVSAGYDSHMDDRISSLGLLEESYYKIMLALSAFSRWSCDGRLGIVLEGGYNHISTSRSVVSTISACMDDYAEGRIKTVDDLKTLFGIDDNYRKKSVRNRDIINKIKKYFNLD
jgi:acetoin utilization deacetylase AcuC-like enzyme